MALKQKAKVLESAEMFIEKYCGPMSRDQWVLVSEGLPEEIEDVFVQVECGAFYVATFDSLKAFSIHDTKECSCDVVKWYLPPKPTPKLKSELCEAWTIS